MYCAVVYSAYMHLNLSSHFIIRTQTQHHFMISWYIMIFQTLSRKSQKPWSITPMRRECCRAQWWHSGQTLLKLGNSCIHPHCTRFGENDNHCFVWCRHLYNFHLPYWKYFHNKTDQWPPEWSDSISLALSAYLVFKLSKTKMEKANNQLKFIGRSKQNS